MSQQIITRLNMSANNVCTGQLNLNVKRKRTFSSNEFAQAIFERNVFVKIEQKLSIIIIVKVLKTSQNMIGGLGSGLFSCPGSGSHLDSHLNE